MTDVTTAAGPLVQGALDRYFAALEALDPERIADAFALDGEIEDPVGTGVDRGREGVIAHFSPMCTALAAQLGIEVVTAQPAGDSIAAHWRMTALARNGGRAEWDGIDVLRVGADGLIVRAEGYWDLQGFLKALGY